MLRRSVDADQRGVTLHGVTTASDTTPTPDPPTHRCCEHCDAENDVHAPHTLGCPEPEVEAVDGEIIDAPSTEVSTGKSDSQTSLAVLDSNPLDTIPPFVHEEKWEHAWLEFEGDKLAYRVPRPSAVTGFSNSQSKYVTNRERGENTQLFLLLHLSKESFNRVMYRMMHPESDYTLFTLARLVSAILEPGVKGLEDELEAGPPEDLKADDEKPS